MVGWLTKNWSLKIVSLILAIGLWYYAVGEEGMEVAKLVPLEIKVLNPQMSVLQTSVKEVQVIFNVPRALLSELATQEITAVHEVSKDFDKAGDYAFRLEAGEIKLKTQQVRITRIEPSLIHVTLDELIVQKLAIEPQFIGDPAFGYRIEKDDMQLNPNAVLVEGPKGQLEKLTAIKTQRINLVGRTRSFRTSVYLDLPSNLRAMGESQVDIYIPITEEIEEKKFEQVPLKILYPPLQPYKIELIPDSVSFSLRGPKKHFERVDGGSILAYVDASAKEPGEYEIPAQIVLPEGVTVKDGNPVIKVIVKK